MFFKGLDMRITLLDTYYPNFLKSFYGSNFRLSKESYDIQHSNLLNQVFGTSDFYSRHLKTLGHEAQDLIVNCEPLQIAWATEHQISYSYAAMKIPARFQRLPILGPKIQSLPGLAKIAIEQIKSIRPDVLYCQDLWFLTPDRLAAIRPYVKLIVGQIASPLPSVDYLRGYDLILTSFPHFVPRLKAIGIKSEYFRIGFDAKILELLPPHEKDIQASFVGGISRHHGKALPMLEYLAENTPIEFFGYGAQRLKTSSAIKSKHHGEVWGLEMYQALNRSQITLNRHINVAENYANNMRLYEATGVGTLLITDNKDNLAELFEPGKEVVVYNTPEEAAELIRYYIVHPEEANRIAQAGQKRTLLEHTYERRMQELVPILEKYIPL